MVKEVRCDICGEKGFAYISFIPNSGWSGNYDFCKKHYREFERFVLNLRRLHKTCPQGYDKAKRGLEKLRELI